MQQDVLVILLPAEIAMQEAFFMDGSLIRKTEIANSFCGNGI